MAAPKHIGEAAAATICPGLAAAYSPGMDMAGMGECAICPTEFMEGEEARVMVACRHGFHVRCMERWRCSHSSCPNCRRNCLDQSVDMENAPPPASASIPGGGISDM